MAVTTGLTVHNFGGKIVGLASLCVFGSRAPFRVDARPVL